MKKPLIKKSHRGRLHKKLGIPEGEKIPVADIKKAEHSSSPALRKEAQFADNFDHEDDDDLDTARQAATRGLFHSLHRK